MESSIIISIILSLLFSAFFSGMEIAFISTDKLHLELITKKGGLSRSILANLASNRSMVISTVLVGNTLALTIYGVLMAGAMEPWLQQYFPDTAVMLVQVVISTLIVLLTAEFLPKSLFMINPDSMLLFFAIPFQVIYYILWVFSAVIVWFSKIILVYVFKGNYSNEKPVFGITDLNNYVTEIVKQLEEETENPELDAKIFNNALEFKKVKVRECMIPRTEIIAVNIEDEIAELQEAFIESGYSKIPVFKESIDNIIGYCHSAKLFKKPKEIKEILSEIIIVPETKLANELLIEFIETRKNIALVVDEFGGTSGIVTMEDVIEMIFGDIQDEYDHEDLIEQQLDDNIYLFSARQEINYLNETYDLKIPEGEYDTLGGFILENLEDIPKENQQVTIDEYHFFIKNMEGLKIDKVQLTIGSDD